MTRLFRSAFSGRKVVRTICVLAVVAAGIFLSRYTFLSPCVVYVRPDSLAGESGVGIDRQEVARHLGRATDALQDSVARKVRRLAARCGIPEDRLAEEWAPESVTGRLRIDASPGWIQRTVRRLRRFGGRTGDLTVDLAAAERDTTLRFTVRRGDGQMLFFGSSAPHGLRSADGPLAKVLCAAADSVVVLLESYENSPADDYMEKINRLRLYEAARRQQSSLSGFARRESAVGHRRSAAAMGILCESVGRVTGDTSALREAARCYAVSSMASRAATATRLADSCAKIDPGAFIGRFFNDSVRLPDSCRQLILVYNDRPDRVSCVFRRYEKQQDRWREAAAPVRANVGRNGIAPYREKREGDGRTPSGAYPMGFAFGYVHDIVMRWPFVTVTKSHFWISDPEDDAYNRMTTERPSTDDFEYLRRDDDAYKYAAVVEYNMHPVEKYMGSAIFFHIESGFDRGSAGCITVTEPETVEVLRWLAPDKAPFMLIGTLPDCFAAE